MVDKIVVKRADFCFRWWQFSLPPIKSLLVRLLARSESVYFLSHYHAQRAANIGAFVRRRIADPLRWIVVDSAVLQPTEQPGFFSDDSNWFALRPACCVIHHLDRFSDLLPVWAGCCWFVASCVATLVIELQRCNGCCQFFVIYAH